MLTEKQVKSLKLGQYPNHVLRMKFGIKHGSVIKVDYMDKEGERRTTEFIGNRQQRKFFKKNPEALINDYKNQTKGTIFQSNKFEAREKQSDFGRFLEFIKSMFGFLNFAKA